MISVSNKYILGFFAVLGAIFINVFSERINDYLRELEQSPSDSANSTSISLQSSTTFLKPSIIQDIDDSADEYYKDKLTERTIPRCANNLSIKCFGEFVTDDYKYIGEIENNLPNGNGIATHVNGFTYRGEFKNGKLDGYGVETDDSYRIIYDGDWKEDMYHGYGIYNLIEHGQNYRGYFKDGDFHGIGKFFYGDRTYDGEWKYDIEHGKGVTVWKNGDVSNGTYVNGMLEGYVEIDYHSGDIFKGYMKAGKKHGQGVHTYKDGTTYNGNYKANLEHGPGTLSYPDGEIHYAEYFHGELHGDKIIKILSDGTKEVGPYKYGVKHGEHTITDKEGFIENAEYKNGLLHGKRTLLWPEGDQEISNYEDGFKSGYSLYIFSNGDEEKCTYMEGRLHGECSLYDKEKKLIQVCLYDQNAKIECNEPDDKVNQIEKMTKKVFGIVGNAAQLIQGEKIE